MRKVIVETKPQLMPKRKGIIIAKQHNWCHVTNYGSFIPTPTLAQKAHATSRKA